MKPHELHMWNLVGKYSSKTRWNIVSELTVTDMVVVWAFWVCAPINFTCTEIVVCDYFFINRILNNSHNCTLCSMNGGFESC